MAAIGRFGARMVPEREQIIRECREKGQLVEGPHIAAFEEEYAQFLGGGHVRAVSTEYGRMGLYFILKALDLPAGSEIIVPALTFWVVPEITRVAGLKPVFVDINPATFTMDPAAAARAITPNTSAILPTHLYGMACDLDPILALAARHNLKVVEDCAHSLGAEYKGQKVGTHGDASFFSFQAFKPLNTFGGGLTWVRDAAVARKVSEFAEAEEWPDAKRVEKILSTGYWQCTFIRPRVFTFSMFPVWWAASFTDWKPEKRLWEEVRRLDPLPPHYRGRFTNVQAGIGRAGLKHLPEFVAHTRRHAGILNELLGGVPGVTVPSVPEGRTHVYYQYCAYVPNTENLVRRCIRRGADVAPMHVDDCTRMALFGWTGATAPGAAKAMTAVQVPVYESLSDDEVARVGRLVRAQVLKDARHRDIDVKDSNPSASAKSKESILET